MRTLPEVAALPKQATRSHRTRLNGVEYVYPVCHVCKRDVVAFSWCDHLSDGRRWRTFFAMCHGAVESVSVDLNSLGEIRMNDFKIETAFLPPILESGAADVARIGHQPTKLLGPSQ